VRPPARQKPLVRKENNIMNKTIKLLALLVFTGAALNACDSCPCGEPTKKMEEAKKVEEAKKNAEETKAKSEETKKVETAKEEAEEA
jgi:hypothetical protein